MRGEGQIASRIFLETSKESSTFIYLKLYTRYIMNVYTQIYTYIFKHIKESCVYKQLGLTGLLHKNNRQNTKNKAQINVRNRKFPIK